MDKPTVITKEDIISLASHQFGIQYHYDDFPSDFIYEFNVEYSGSQLLQISVIRPDQSQILLLSRSFHTQTQKLYIMNEFFQLITVLKKIFKFIFLKWNSIIKTYQAKI